VTVGVLEVANDEFQRMWEVHVLAHVYACRDVIPGMVERGGGAVVNTASAAGLLSQIGSLAYSVTKHAAVSLAEWLAITYAHLGIQVAVLCPQAVETKIVENSPSRDRMGGGADVAGGDGVLQPADVAEVVIQSLRDERFWALPHPEVAEYAKRKAGDVDRWLGGMQRFQERLFRGQPNPGEWLVS
jgi:NAD(P)-dependent dehydrogenase (short-subunit alcohol dehydrogenase family)